jgi:hypothetical protein
LECTNPWLRAPERPPYVLPEDVRGTAAFALNKVPCPWSGPAFSASVLMLSLNPGLSVDDQDQRDLEDPAFVAMAKDQLMGLAPFPWLQDQWAHAGGARCWRARLRRLAQDVGEAAIGERFAVIEWLGYASARFITLSAPVPSQDFAGAVVRQAMEREAVIVVARSWRRLVALVPGLQSYPVVCMRSVMSPYLTPRNAGEDGYERVVTMLRDA